MSFIVEHKTDKYTYLCKITSYWDKEKKQPRQKREYVGKKDSITGKIIPLRSRLLAPVCKHYGATYLLYCIAKSIGLSDLLCELFPHEWDQILSCAFYEIIEKRPLYLCGQWASTTYLESTASLSSQRVSELLKSLGEQSGTRLSFAKRWAQAREEREYIAFDITSISSYAKLIEIIEYGYNRDKEKLPQINLGMLFGYASMLPIFYTVYPGSIKDVSTIDNMLSFIEHLELKNVIFVFDKGFYSEDNIRALLNKKRKFLIAAPFTVKKVRDLVVQHGVTIGQANNSFVVNDNVGFGIETKINLADKNLKAYVYIDKRKKIQAEEQMIKQFAIIESYLIEHAGDSIKRVKVYLDERHKGWQDICNLKKNKKHFALQQNKKGINEALAYKGSVVIVGNSGMKAKEALSLYRDKDVVEKAFDNLKNELDTNRLCVHSEVSMQGRLFVAFVALIVYSAINKIMKDHDVYQSFTFDEVMRELNKINIINLGDKKRYTEITKNQKYLLKLFKITLPSHS